MRGCCILTIIAAWLAALPFAAADIVWSGSVNQYLPLPFFPASELPLDINGDEIDDFIIRDGDAELIFDPEDGNLAIATPTFGPYYRYIRFDDGVLISSDLSNLSYEWWDGQASVIAGASFSGVFGYGGPFAYTNGYFGISFNIAGSTHYGWIHISNDPSWSDPFDRDLLIHDWAWETEADTPIVTGAIPEPSSGVLVVFGALSLWQFRRSHRRKYCSTPGW